MKDVLKRYDPFVGMVLPMELDIKVSERPSGKEVVMRANNFVGIQRSAARSVLLMLSWWIRIIKLVLQTFGVTVVIIVASIDDVQKQFSSYAREEATLSTHLKLENCVAYTAESLLRTSDIRSKGDSARIIESSLRPQLTKTLSNFYLFFNKEQMPYYINGAQADGDNSVAK
uniref:Uncharacterized protein n=1 Tax=Glossina austeni TaxID=7395 RepID=A0A1A9UR28_GLOAU